MAARLSIGEAIGRALALTRPNLVLLVTSLIIAFVTSLFTLGFLSGATLLAFGVICLRVVDGEECIQSSDLQKNLGALVIPAIMLTLLSLSGLLACGLGVLITLPVAQICVFRRIDRPGVSEFEIFKEVWSTIVSNGLWHWLFLQVVILPIIAAIGVLGCGIGSFATFALATMISTCAYRQVFPRN